MLYVVIELQKNGDVVGNIVTTYDNRNAAESKYYSVLSAAAVSTVEKHSCALLTEDGFCLMSNSYEHKVESNEE